MNKFTATILAIGILAAVLPSQLVSQTISAGTMATEILVVPADTNTAQTVVFDNAKYNRVITPISIAQKIGTATGEASTNTTSIAYRKSGSTTAYRVGGITAQTYGAESLAALSSYPPLLYGDQLEITPSALSNITYIVTFAVSFPE